MIVVGAVAVLCFCVVVTASAFADDSAKIVGTWKLVSFMNEFQDGTEPRGMYGIADWVHHLHAASPDDVHREAEGRKSPQTDEEQDAAYRSLISYTGTYRLEGDQFITKVDVSWNPGWVNMEQARFFKLDGDRLQVISPWVMSPNFGKVTRPTLTWERVK